MRAALIVLIAIAVLLPMSALAVAPKPAGVTLRVPGTSNPYLAGMPSGTKSAFGDRAPEQSPVLVELSLRDAVAVTFTASGGVQNHPYDPPNYDPPDGSSATNHRAEHGISEVTSPLNSLVGVFLGDDRPDRSPAPPPLDFHAIGRDFVSLSPQLKQIFFIGAGTAKARVAGAARMERVARRFIVPKGATRLFLGTMDEYEWDNNGGFFQVTVTMERSAVGSRVSFAKWACLPNRTLCTPDRESIESRGLPEPYVWTLNRVAPAVVTDPRAMPAALGRALLAPDEGAGALIGKTVGGRTYFSVDDRSGVAFQSHEGYFEFDVTVQ